MFWQTFKYVLFDVAIAYEIPSSVCINAFFCMDWKCKKNIVFPPKKTQLVNSEYCFLCQENEIGKN
jgi:hypothetical protein